MAKVIQIPVRSIFVPEGVARHREATKDVSDIVETATDFGILQPIGVYIKDPKKKTYNLIWGERRWLAAKKMGHEVISACLVNEREDVNSPAVQLQMEKMRLTENSGIPFSPQEKLDLCQSIEAMEPAKRGRRKDGDKTTPNGRKREQIAKELNTSASTLNRTQEVVEHGDEDIIDEMNQTGNVAQAHTKVKEAKKKANAKKNGKVAFDDRTLTTCIGMLPRKLDDVNNLVKERASALKCKGTDEHTDMLSVIDQINELHESLTNAWTRWQKATS